MSLLFTGASCVLGFAKRGDDDGEEDEGADMNVDAVGLRNVEGWGLEGSSFCMGRLKARDSLLMAASVVVSEPKVGARMGTAFASFHCEEEDALVGIFEEREPNCVERGGATTGAGAVRKDDEVPN